MLRVTLTFDDELMGEIDEFMESRGYSNRSEAVRDLTRAGLAQGIEAVGETRDCLASLTFVYDPETRELAKRLAIAYRDRPELTATRMQRPLPGGEVLEVTLLEGATTAIRAFAASIRAERGVRNGELVIIPA
ncbi:MAG: nickel-responsive transcriptional regulator NikR [Siculibacillus sp.]|nr:nickel-responsive transcriptional regulator NikR [Siculibacillus sp.]